MTLYLPRDLFSQIHEDAAVNPASRRKVVLPRIARQILESQGYRFGSKIRVPGGYAFDVTDPDGRAIKLGLKTAVNRWLNTATPLVEMVDTIIIATFEWDEEDERPVKFELIEIGSPTLLKMIDKVRKAAVKRGWDKNGHYYMPLDEELIEDDNVQCVAGAVIPAGRVIYGPERVTWINDEWGRFESPQNSPPAGHGSRAVAFKAIDVGSLVAKTKSDLATTLGIPVENIDLAIRF